MRSIMISDRDYEVLHAEAQKRPGASKLKVETVLSEILELCFVGKYPKPKYPKPSPAPKSSGDPVVQGIVKKLYGDDGDEGYTVAAHNLALCGQHPHYTAQRKPRTQCVGCWAAYDARHPTRRSSDDA